MAKKKRRGVTLFELLRKDHADARTALPRPPTGVSQQQQAAAPRTQVPANTPVKVHEPPRSVVEAEDEDAIVFHMSRPLMAAIGVAGVVLLVLCLLIGSRMFGAGQPATEQQVASGTPGGPGPDSEQMAPLASLAERARSELIVTPEPPIRLPRESQSTDSEAMTLETPFGTAVARSPRQADPGTGAAAADQATAGNLPQADTRKPGLNYVIVQIIRPDVKPSAHEHAAEVRKFLASKGIRTLAIPAGGGIRVVSEQGFDWDDPADKARCVQLMERIRQVGKEYASAKYLGGYNFASPYAAKHPEK